MRWIGWLVAGCGDRHELPDVIGVGFDGPSPSPPGSADPWDPGGQTQTFREAEHHSEHEALRRVEPAYPPDVTGVGDQRCMATVAIDQGGVPTAVTVTHCDARFHDSTRAALLEWRWVPMMDGESAIPTETTLAVTYRRDG